MFVRAPRDIMTRNSICSPIRGVKNENKEERHRGCRPTGGLIGKVAPAASPRLVSVTGPGETDLFNLDSKSNL